MYINLANNDTFLYAMDKLIKISLHWNYQDTVIYLPQNTKKKYSYSSRKLISKFVRLLCSSFAGINWALDIKD